MKKVWRVNRKPLIKNGFVKRDLATIKSCTVLLSKKEIRRIKFVAILQLILALIDFLGVITIGLVGTLSVYGIQSRAPSGQIKSLLELLHLSNLSFQRQVAIVGSIAGLVLILKSIVSAWITRRTMFFLANRSADISNRILYKLTFSNFEQIQKRSRFENIFAMTNGVQSITVGVIGQSISLFSDLVLIIIMFVGLLLVDISIALSTVFFFGSVAFALYRLVSRRVVALAKEDADIQVANGRAIYELFGSYREIFVRGIRDRYVENLSKLRRRQAKVQASSGFISNVSKYVLEISFVIGAFIFIGFQFIFKDAAGAISAISIFLASAGRMIPAIFRVQTAGMSFRGAIAVADRTFRILEELKNFEPESTSLEGGTSLDFKGEIAVKEVSFAYLGSSFHAVQNVNIQIKDGEWIAIVGPTGAGKTTLVDLILGVLKPTHGSIKVSGMYPEAAIQKWPGRFAYVPQVTFIAQGNIEENVALGTFGNEVNKGQAIASLRKVGLEDFVSKTENGLKQDVGELGSKLSGGQKQRLGLARALYTDPRIIVLDEATSALDNISEKSIVDLLNEIKGRTTIISIAHRLSTVMNADRIFYMEDGEIKASGTFSEVRRKVPNFDKQAQLGNIEQVP